ncbi:hypothetical protein GN956_G9006 [Arapaima gigas]
MNLNGSASLNRVGKVLPETDPFALDSTTTVSSRHFGNTAGAALYTAEDERWARSSPSPGILAHEAGCTSIWLNHQCPYILRRVVSFPRSSSEKSLQGHFILGSAFMCCQQRCEESAEQPWKRKTAEGERKQERR